MSESLLHSMGKSVSLDRSDMKQISGYGLSPTVGTQTTLKKTKNIPDSTAVLNVHQQI